MSIFAPALGALWKQLEGYRIDPDPLFREFGIDPELLFDQGARIPVTQYQKLELRAAELANDPLFSLKGAEYSRPAHLGALGFAWLASSTLRTAFQRLERYARMINERLRVTLEEDESLFYVSLRVPFPALPDEMRENGQLSALVKFCRIIAGKDFHPAEIRFRHPEPADTAYYYEFFRCPVRFGQERTLVSIPIEWMDKRLTGSNDQLAKMNEHIVVRYLAHAEKSDIVNRVKATIIDQLGTGEVSESVIADGLHMTPRNLHRKLSAEGTSYKALLTEVRQDLAKQYIQDRSMTLTEISFMLGFSEVSSFSRAYKGWTGQPPSEARRAAS